MKDARLKGLREAMPMIFFFGVQRRASSGGTAQRSYAAHHRISEST